MAKFKRKPTVIDAFQWTGDWKPKEDPKWITDAMKKGGRELGAARMIGDGSMRIVHESGILTAHRGDFIIRGPQGDLYPCKKEVFFLLHDELPE